MNKRKILVMAMALAMCAILVVGGTLAYFTDFDKADNVFEVGNVKIRQNEWERGEEGIQEFTQKKNVLPAVLKKLTKEPVTVGEGDNEYTFNIRSQKGNYIDKIVDVTNTGTNLAYVRTIIAVPNMNGFDDSANASFNPLHWNYLDATDFAGSWDWNGSNDAEVTEQKCYAQDVMINGASYDLYVATHIDPVEAGATTAPSMVGFYLHDTVGHDVDGYFFLDAEGVRHSLNEWMKADENGIVTLKFLVFTQACQVEGFDDAWEALDTAFGEITAENNPWY